MNLRKALAADEKKIMYIIDQAKAYLKNLGVDQWQKDYPNEISIQTDIQKGIGYVAMDGDMMAAYACIDFGGEAAYSGINGSWKSEQPYAAIHRMAILDEYKGRGMSKEIFQFAEQLCKEQGVYSIKVDTDADNKTMQHLLQKYGYEYCGVVQFDNSDKTAFEKLL